VMKRELAKAPGKIADLRRRIPVFYMVFDVIAWGGADYTVVPLSGRQERLAGLRETDHVRVVESVPERGRALWGLVEEQDLEGIVAKQMDSPYLIGTKSALWKKIKVWRSMKALVGGWSEAAGRVRSLAPART
jgi:bifunctional non-homologous end joining protein LigD